MEENQVVLIITVIVFFPYILWNMASVLKSIIVDKIYGTKNRERLSLQETQKIQENPYIKRVPFQNKLTYRQVQKLIEKSANIMPKNLRIRVLEYKLELMQVFLSCPLILSVVLFCKPCYAVLIGALMYISFVMSSRKAPRFLYNTISLLPLVCMFVFYVCFQFVSNSFMAKENFILIAKGYTCVCAFLYSFLAWYAYKKYNSMTKEEYDEIQKILQRIEGGEI